MDQMNFVCDSGHGSIENGFVCYNGTVAGSLATYRCNEGYMLTGTEERLCGSDGRWSGDMSSCTPINNGKFGCRKRVNITTHEVHKNNNLLFRPLKYAFIRE